MRVCCGGGFSSWRWSQLCKHRSSCLPPKPPSSMFRFYLVAITQTLGLRGGLWFNLGLRAACVAGGSSTIDGARAVGHLGETLDLLPDVQSGQSTHHFLPIHSGRNPSRHKAESHPRLPTPTLFPPFLPPLASYIDLVAPAWVWP